MRKGRRFRSLDMIIIKCINISRPKSRMRQLMTQVTCAQSSNNLLHLFSMSECSSINIDTSSNLHYI